MAHPIGFVSLFVFFGLACGSASADFLKLVPAKEEGSLEGFLQKRMTQARFVGVDPDFKTDYLRVVFSKVIRGVEAFKSDSPNEYTVKDTLEITEEAKSRFGTLFYCTEKVKAKVRELQEKVAKSQSKDMKKLDLAPLNYLLSLPVAQPDAVAVVTAYFKTLAPSVPTLATDADVDAFFQSLVEGKLTSVRSAEASLLDLSALADSARAQFGYLFNFRPDQIQRVQALIDATDKAIVRRAASDSLLSFLLTPVVFDVKSRFPNDHEAPTLSLLEVPQKLVAGQTAKIVFQTKDEAGYATPMPSLYAELDWDKKQDTGKGDEHAVRTQVGFGQWEGGMASIRSLGKDKYEMTMTVPPHLRPGRYHWRRFSVSDKLGQRNEIEADREQPKYRRWWQGHSDYIEIAKDVGHDGDLIEVQIESANPDVEPPRLVSVTLDHAKLKHGELQTARLRVTDDKSGFDPKLEYCWGFSRVDASGKHLEGTERGYLHGCEGRDLKDDGKGGWTSVFPVLTWLKPGRYLMDRMFLRDRAGNLNPGFRDEKTGLITFPTGETLRPLEFEVEQGPAYQAVTRGPRAYAMEARGTMNTDEKYQFYVKVLDDETGSSHAGRCGSAPSLTTPHGWWSDSLSVCGSLDDAGQGWRSIAIHPKAVPTGRHLVYSFTLSDNRGDTTDVEAVTAAKFQVMGFRQIQK